MNLREELVERLARRRNAELGGLSPAAYAELVLAVREDPHAYMTHPSDEAFEAIVGAVGQVLASRNDDEWRDDDEFLKERTARMARLANVCARTVDAHPESLHARLVHVLACDLEPDDQLDALLALERDVEVERGALVAPESGDAWHDVFLHGRLRLLACIARTCLDGARYRMAARYGEMLLAASPEDVLGARHTIALCHARLEDEESFEALDARFGRRGDSWQQLGRVLLFYKLGRMAAARRALRGFASLCEGGPYALLRPVMVDTYLPDRPDAEPYSFAEVTIAVHEADPIICDVPDFCSWAAAQDGFEQQAMAYAERNGFGW